MLKWPSRLTTGGEVSNLLPWTIFASADANLLPPTFR